MSIPHIKWNALRLLPIFALVLLGTSSAPQKVTLHHADTLHTTTRGRELIGHVKVSRGLTVINSERALQSALTGEITLTGGVHLADPDHIVDADVVTYSERTGDFVATGSVELQIADSLLVNCDRAHYTDKSQTAELFDEVRIEVTRDHSVVTGGYGKFIATDSSGVIEDSVMYRLPDLVDSLHLNPDTLVVTSNQLSFSRRDHSALFTGEVHLSRGDVLAVADSLYHWPDSSKTRLEGSPIIWRGSDELSGRQIQMLYNGRTLRSIVVEGDAMALSRVSTSDDRRNRLEGSTLTVTTPNDSTREVVSEGKAVGWYFVLDASKVYQGVNVIAADRIQLLIVNDKTNAINSEGKTSGAFYPPGAEPPEVNTAVPKVRDGIGWGEL